MLANVSPLPLFSPYFTYSRDVLAWQVYNNELFGDRVIFVIACMQNWFLAVNFNNPNINGSEICLTEESWKIEWIFLSFFIVEDGDFSPPEFEPHLLQGYSSLNSIF